MLLYLSQALNKLYLDQDALVQSEKQLIPVASLAYFPEVFFMVKKNFLQDFETF